MTHPTREEIRLLMRRARANGTNYIRLQFGLISKVEGIDYDAWWHTCGMFSTRQVWKTVQRLRERGFRLIGLEARR